MGKKPEKKFIPQTRISRPKNDGKISSGKGAKTRFFINTEYRDQKMGGGKNAKKIFKKHTIRYPKNKKKIIWKKCENTFF